jgi:hypothetical protein
LFEARLNAGARLDDPRQFPKRGLLEHDLAPIRRREVSGSVRSAVEAPG